jgi:hypothetical protein
VTLVTLDCRPFDIVKSVSRGPAAVYSPTVLRSRDQPGARRARLFASWGHAIGPSLRIDRSEVRERRVRLAPVPTAQLIADPEKDLEGRGTFCQQPGRQTGVSFDGNQGLPNRSRHDYGRLDGGPRR